MTPKVSALDVNLTRLKGVMSTAINNSISSLSIYVEATFSGFEAQVSQAEFEAKMSSLESFNVTDLQNTGNYYDSRSFPDGWRQAYSDAVNALKPSALVMIVAAWTQWSTNLKTGRMEGLTNTLVDLGQSKGVGQGNAYASESLTRSQLVKDDFNGLVDSHYRWNDKADLKAQFAAMVDNAAQTRRALWDQNDLAVRTQLTTLIQRLQLQFDIKLQDAMIPQVEPAAYSVVTDDLELKVCELSMCH